jgi:putative nucleotidyltransferase with HDIG domain
MSGPEDTGAHRTSWRDLWTRFASPGYVGLVVAGGVIVLAASARSMFVHPPDVRWLVLAALTAASGVLMLRMPEVPVSFSISDVFTFTTALMFGPAAGAIVVAIDAAVISMRFVRSQRSLSRYLFNVSAAAVAMFASASAFFASSATGPLAGNGAAIVQHVAALALFAALYFALNTGLVAIAVALNGDRAPWRTWRTHFMSLWPGYVGGASAAALALFLISTRSGDLRMLALVTPIPFILYFGFRTAVERMQDHVAHLTRVNSMYLTTIETLAQAVDARDQVTHDHIRRVQKNAMRLARELGITDKLELQALEAAALLHDTGKLAIPEHILNKPDKLTPAEFETMKLHATIGADILSPIGFPFPVVPIVRHHHENWDGSGYPDGLRGEHIPIGARILSVVDCYDALTSDRPYRRALSGQRALGVILERSGVMYDPDVVAALMRIAHELADGPLPEPGQSLVETIAHANQAIKREPGASSTITAATVHMAGRLGEIVGRHRDVGALCRDLHQRISEFMPGLTMVLYAYDPQLGALFARSASGVHADAVADLTIEVGLRLTGWVAANKTTIVNSEAALDLGNLATKLQPIPQLCLSTPMAVAGDLVGVLTVYSTTPRPFTANDAALLEMLAGLLAPILADEARTRGPAAEDAAASDPVRAVRVSVR